MFSVGQKIGRYQIRAPIGAGGMGEVFLAEDVELERLVALKIIPQEFAAETERIQRFIQEAKSASALNHPNILTIYEIGSFDGSRFMASEFVVGETLRDRLHTPLEVDEAIDVIIQVASALQTAHQAGIIHRDIKPENIMIREDGIVKVLDFGLAKLIERPVQIFDKTIHPARQFKTQPGIVLGTVPYMSPEQSRGRQLDARSDIFSLGIVFYEMLSGQLPFYGESVNDIIVAILTEEPKSLSEFSGKFPPLLVEMVAKLLRKNPDERYQSMKGLALELKSLKSRLEIEAELQKTRMPYLQTIAENSENLAINSTIKFTDSEEIDLEIARRSKATDKVVITLTNNLTGSVSQIVGRDDEIEKILELLKSDNVRLLTLTGIGGTGKTTLAQAVLRQASPDFRDGVFIVKLAAISQPELVVPAISHALGVKETGSKPIFEVLKEFLQDRQALLVIDNFEQVLPVAPQVAELLVSAPELKILITSRALLRISAEREFAVPPLAVPSQINELSPEDLLNYEAVKLFIERAKQAKSNFELTGENARNVAEICAQLDGIPLAIELAAARVSILTPRAILTKLENRLRLLTGGARDLPLRQQTMRSAIAWSYDLLNETEKSLFRQFAVFEGGFTFESAETICRKNEAVTDEIEFLDTIASLIDKSLLLRKESPDGEIRFRTLKIVREFALEMLELSGEADSARKRHAEYFLALGEEAEPYLRGSKSAEWLNRLQEEHDNIRATLRYFLKHDILKAARLAGAIRNFWTLRNFLLEGQTWLKSVLEESPDLPSAAKCKLLNGLALAAWYRGDYETARKIYEEALAESRTANDLQQIAIAGNGLGLVAYQQHDLTEARKHIEEGLTISRRLDDKSGIAFSLSFLGDLARMEAKHDDAHPLFSEALTISKQLGYKQSVSSNLINLGAVALKTGKLDEAGAHFSEAFKVANELGYKKDISYSLDGFAALATQAGEFERAAKISGAAEKMRESIGFKMEPVEQQFRDDYLVELKKMMSYADFSIAYEEGRNIKIEENLSPLIGQENLDS